MSLPESECVRLVRQWRRIEIGWSARHYLTFILLTGLVALILALSGCVPQQPAPIRPAAPRTIAANLQPAPGVPGDPNNGMLLFTARGCVACHTVLRAPNATGAIGPNLTNMVLRPTIAGDQIQNTPDNLARWIVNPPAMKPGTQMPVLGVNDQDARDLAAFLYSLPYNPVR
jgi:cytochrome c